MRVTEQNAMAVTLSETMHSRLLAFAFIHPALFAFSNIQYPGPNQQQSIEQAF
jgi:hypothetical protein